MHTKGKWIARENKYGTAVEITGDERAGMCSIAEVEIGFDQPFESEQQANIKLMCAAPALLEALEVVMSCPKLREIGGTRCCIYIDDSQLDLIKAAIAAAKGE